MPSPATDAGSERRLSHAAQQPENAGAGWPKKELTASGHTCSLTAIGTSTAVSGGTTITKTHHCDVARRPHSPAVQTSEALDQYRGSNPEREPPSICLRASWLETRFRSYGRLFTLRSDSKVHSRLLPLDGSQQCSHGDPTCMQLEAHAATIRNGDFGRAHRVPMRACVNC